MTYNVFGGMLNLAQPSAGPLTLSNILYCHSFSSFISFSRVLLPWTFSPFLSTITLPDTSNSLTPLYPVSLLQFALCLRFVSWFWCCINRSSADAEGLRTVRRIGRTHVYSLFVSCNILSQVIVVAANMTDLSRQEYDWHRQLSHINMTDSDLRKYDWRRWLGDNDSGY